MFFHKEHRDYKSKSAAESVEHCLSRIQRTARNYHNTAKHRVIKARKLQAKRYENDGILTNSELTADLIKKYCVLDDNSAQIMKLAAQKYQLSGRKYNRVLKIARTIADLSDSENIKSEHITQALQYRADNL